MYKHFGKDVKEVIKEAIFKHLLLDFQQSNSIRPHFIGI